MLCDICAKKKATVHLTEIVDDQMTEMHLCEDCAKEKSVQMEQQFGLADLLAGLTDFGKHVKNHKKDELKCHHCGMTYDEFRKLGRLGCSECYETFKDNLSSLLKKIHGANNHLGKAPCKLTAQARKKIDSLQDFKTQLLKAIQLENFEKAAELRDKIRELESKGKK
ncbi:MAG: UvrB/UvrC motif-containing protein [Candidatus Omnitrophica bacterium]|nr:UvrB/UvrC motif-containing protein [Candidatus Omnitrophota bacterium]